MLDSKIINSNNKTSGFFDNIDSPEKAFWLGVLIHPGMINYDGSIITHTKNNRKIELIKQFCNTYNFNYIKTDKNLIIDNISLSKSIAKHFIYRKQEVPISKEISETYNKPFSFGYIIMNLQRTKLKPNDIIQIHSKDEKLINVLSQSLRKKPTVVQYFVNDAPFWKMPINKSNLDWLIQDNIKILGQKIDLSFTEIYSLNKLSDGRKDLYEYVKNHPFIIKYLLRSSIKSLEDKVYVVYRNKVKYVQYAVLLEELYSKKPFDCRIWSWCAKDGNNYNLNYNNVEIHLK